MKLGVNSSIWSHAGLTFVDSLDRCHLQGSRCLWCHGSNHVGYLVDSPEHAPFREDGRLSCHHPSFRPKGL